MKVRIVWQFFDLYSDVYTKSEYHRRGYVEGQLRDVCIN
jgi:hypothetical protein